MKRRFVFWDDRRVPVIMDKIRAAGHRLDRAGLDESESLALSLSLLTAKSEIDRLQFKLDEARRVIAGSRTVVRRAVNASAYIRELRGVAESMDSILAGWYK